MFVYVTDPQLKEHFKIRIGDIAKVTGPHYLLDVMGLSDRFFKKSVALNSDIEVQYVML